MNLKDGIAPPSGLQDTFARLRERRDATLGLSFGERLAALEGLRRLLRENAAALAAAVDEDFRGRARQETRLLEIFPAVEAIAHARRHLRSWMVPRRARTNFWFLPGRSRVVMQPLGVVGIDVPWNYPVYLAVGPTPTSSP